MTLALDPRLRYLHRAAVKPDHGLELAGLFDRPDRAIDALRRLVADTDHDRARIAGRLAERLRSDAGARFWTEADMREYVELVNELLRHTGVGLLGPEGSTSRMGIKVSNRPKGRYTLFRFKGPSRQDEWCSRNVPADLTVGHGPS